MSERRFAIGAGLALAFLVTSAGVALHNARTQRELALRGAAAADAAPEAAAAAPCPDGMRRVEAGDDVLAFCIDRAPVSADAYGPCVEAGVCRGADDAVTYCAARGKRTPTDAELRRAARGAPPADARAEASFRCAYSAR